MTTNPNVSLFENVINDDTLTFKVEEVNSFTFQNAIDRVGIVGRLGTAFTTQSIAGGRLEIYTTPNATSYGVSSVISDSNLLLQSSPADLIYQLEYRFFTPISGNQTINNFTQSATLGRPTQIATASQTYPNYTLNSVADVIVKININQNIVNFGIVSYAAIDLPNVSLINTTIESIKDFRVEEAKDVLVGDAIDRKAVIGRSTYFTQEATPGDKLIIHVDPVLEISIDSIPTDTNILLQVAPPEQDLFNKPYSFENIIIITADQVIPDFVSNSSGKTIARLNAANVIDPVTQNTIVKTVATATVNQSFGGFVQSGLSKSIVSVITPNQTFGNFTQTTSVTRPTQYATANQTFVLPTQNTVIKTIVSVNGNQSFPGMFTQSGAATNIVSINDNITFDNFTQSAQIFKVSKADVYQVIEDFTSTVSAKAIVHSASTSQISNYGFIALIRRKQKQKGIGTMMF